MDVARKFIQMGRTRSLRYALRKGGKKYEPSKSINPSAAAKDEGKDEDGTYQVKRATGERLKVIPRTGKVYDEEKLRGAEIFRSYEGRCWDDEVYKAAFDDWKSRHGATKKAQVKDKGEDVKLESSSEDEELSETLEKAEDLENSDEVGNEKIVEEDVKPEVEASHSSKGKRKSAKRKGNSPHNDSSGETKPEADASPQQPKRQRRYRS